MEDNFKIGVFHDYAADFSGAFNYFGDRIWITKVICKNPYVIVFWSDNTKTMSKCAEGDKFSKEGGLSIAVMKKLFGSKETHNLLSTWTPENETITLKDVRKGNK